MKRDSGRHECSTRSCHRRPHWADWSIAQLEAASLHGPVLINDVVYAELAVRYGRIEELEALVSEAGLEIVPTPRAALFLAGKVFMQYRKSGGSRTGFCPTFSLALKRLLAN